MIEANYDEVICPNCVTQFRAIPVNVQDQIIALTAERDALKAEVALWIRRSDKTWHEKHYTEQISALKDAARLALDALEGVVDFDPDSKAQWSVSGGAYEAHECNSAINALKAVL